jgi:hypothetical protein
MAKKNDIKRKKDRKDYAKNEKAIESKQNTYKQDVVKTVSPLGLGAVAGIISYFINLEAHRDPLGIIVLVLFIYVHKFILPKFDIEPAGKDWAVISFLSFTTWYISWTFMLNA